MEKRDSVQKEMLAVSATTTTGVRRGHNRPLLLQDRRHKMTEEDLRKEVPPEAVVLEEGKIEKVQKITSKETAQIRRVPIGIFPCVKTTNLNRDAKSAKNAYSGTLRLTVRPTKSPRKVVEKDRLPS